MKYLILVGFAVFGFVGATYQCIWLNKFLRRGIKTRGKRVGYSTETDADNIKYEVPELEFLDHTGKVRRAILGTNFFNKKNELEIIFDPNNPKKIIEDYWTKHIGWIFFLIIGILALSFILIESHISKS